MRFANLTDSDGMSPANGLQLRWLANGSLQLVTGSGTVLGASGVGLVLPQNWHYVELGVTFGSSQTAQVRLDGTEVINLSGVNTRGGLSSSYTRFSIQYSTGYSFYFDDFYLADNTGGINNTFLGPVKIYTLMPDGAGDSTEWTPSAGSNWECVDEQIMSSDTVSANTAGLVDLYAMQNLPACVTNVLGVMTGHRSIKSDAGPRKVRSKLRVGSDTKDGVIVDLGMSKTLLTQEMHERQPDSTSTWTVAAVNGMQVGVESV